MTAMTGWTTFGIAATVLLIVTAGTAEGTVKPDRPGAAEYLVASPDDTTTAEKWEMTPNPQLTGATGRIVVNVPTEAQMIFHVLRPGEEEHIEAWYESAAGNFMPGAYDVRIWEVRIEDVPVERGTDTRIRVGVLDVTAGGIWEILDENRQRAHNNSIPQRVVLPVGTYYVKMSSGEQKVTIEDGEVTVF